MICWTFLGNVIDINHNGKTPYEARYGVQYDGPKYPFGCHVLYRPASQKDRTRTPEFGDKWLHGIFVGYWLNSGGRWSNQLIVVGWEELEEATSAGKVSIKQFQQGEVRPQLRNDQFVFPLAERSLRQPEDGLRQRRARRLEEKQKKEAEEEAEARREAEQQASRETEPIDIPSTV